MADYLVQAGNLDKFAELNFSSADIRNNTKVSY